MIINRFKIQDGGHHGCQKWRFYKKKYEGRCFWLKMLREHLNMCVSATHIFYIFRPSDFFQEFKMAAEMAYKGNEFRNNCMSEYYCDKIAYG